MTPNPRSEVHKTDTFIFLSDLVRYQPMGFSVVPSNVRICVVFLPCLAKSVFRNIRYSCIFYHISTMSWYSVLKSLLMEHHGFFILHCQCHGCRHSGNDNSHCVKISPDSKVHGPVWDRPHVGPINFAIWDIGAECWFSWRLGSTYL